MEVIAGRLDQFDMFSPEQDDMAASIFGAARPLSLDGQGRIVVPEELMEYARLDHGAQAAVVGMGRKFQIWDPDTFKQRQDGARRNVEAQGLTLPGEAGSGPPGRGGASE